MKTSFIKYRADGSLSSYGTTVITDMAELSTTEHTAVVVPRGSYDNHYWDGASVQPRATIAATWDKLEITADSVDTATLTGLPIPVDISINGVIYNVTDGTLSVTIDLPGKLFIVIDEVAYEETAYTIVGV